MSKWKSAITCAAPLIISALMVSLFAAPSRAEQDVFIDISTRANYMEVAILFKLQEGALDGGGEIEVLRSERKSGPYEPVGLAKYNKFKGLHEFKDQSVKKTSYYYKLSLKGKGITSDPFKGNALLLPPGT